MGRPATPQAVLRLQGTYRKDRHGNRGPKTGGEPLRKPDDLPEHASWLWDEVTRLRASWLCGSDAASLQTLCMAYELMRRTAVKLHDDPANKDVRCSWTAYVGVFTSMGAKFGLTPSDRARLGEDKPERDDQDEMREMLR